MHGVVNVPLIKAFQTVPSMQAAAEQRKPWCRSRCCCVGPAADSAHGTHRLRAGPALVEDIRYDLAEVGCWLLLLGCCCCTGRPGLPREGAPARVGDYMGAAAVMATSHPRAVGPLQHLAADQPVAGAGSEHSCRLKTTQTGAYVSVGVGSYYCSFAAAHAVCTRCLRTVLEAIWAGSVQDPVHVCNTILNYCGCFWLCGMLLQASISTTWAAPLEPLTELTMCSICRLQYFPACAYWSHGTSAPC
jgi:hypothetical protein